jgi:hypothetical protein
MHLKGLYLKILRVPAVRAGQGHASSSSLPQKSEHNCGRKKRAIRPEYERALYEMLKGKRNAKGQKARNSSVFLRDLSCYRLSRSGSLPPNPSKRPV